MAYEIRPLSFGEILDFGFRVLRDRFTLIAGTTAAVYVPYMLGIEAIQTQQGQPLQGFGIIALLVSVVCMPAMQAALTACVAETYLDRPISMGQAYSRAFGIYLPLLGTFIILGLLVMLGFLALIVPGIYLAISWALVGPIMVVEGRFGMKALNRSRDLMRGNWWRGFGVLFVAGLIVAIVGTSLTVIFLFIPVVGTLLNAIVSSITAAYSAVVLVVLYFDLRCRHEDFDLHFLSEQVRGEALTAPTDPGQV